MHIKLIKLTSFGCDASCDCAQIRLFLSPVKFVRAHENLTIAIAPSDPFAVFRGVHAQNRMPIVIKVAKLFVSLELI